MAGKGKENRDLLKLMEDGRKLPIEARIKNMHRNAEMLEYQADNLRKQLGIAEDQLKEMVGAIKFAEAYLKDKDFIEEEKGQEKK